MSSRQAGSNHEGGSFRCPRCTYENHPSLLSCEVCGASLVSAADRRLELETPNRDISPGPSLGHLSLNDDISESIKFSFRAGGDRVFHERLKNALVQRKWLLQNAPPIPKPIPSPGPSNGRITQPVPQHKMVGISALECRDAEIRKNNEVIIGNAFSDLEALRTSAKEIIALAEQFRSQANFSNGGVDGARAEAQNIVSALGLTTTKDMLGSDSLYSSELSRNLAEYLTDDKRGVLKREGGIMSLVDLWAVFNRARNGVELVSPTDFAKAAELWDKLRLPVRLRRFKSGLLVVQGRDRTDEKTIASILTWLKELHVTPPMEDVPWNWQAWGRGVTAQETAERFGWSVGVATEELEMAEEKGALCREQGIDGVRFWENWLIALPTSALPT
jgi:ESCRT-II complex subunit VPS36